MRLLSMRCGAVPVLQPSSHVGSLCTQPLLPVMRDLCGSHAQPLSACMHMSRTCRPPCAPVPCLHPQVAFPELRHNGKWYIVAKPGSTFEVHVQRGADYHQLLQVRQSPGQVSRWARATACKRGVSAMSAPAVIACVAHCRDLLAPCHSAACDRAYTVRRDSIRPSS